MNFQMEIIAFTVEDCPARVARIRAVMRLPAADAVAIAPRACILAGMKARLILPLLLGLGSAQAQTQFSTVPPATAPDGPAELFGVWGSESQCRAYGDGDETNPALLPYAIDGQWIRQGFIYCYLSWRGRESKNGITRAWADARCGEDDLRDYRLQLELRERRLSIRWSEDFIVSQLQSCSR